MPMTKGSGPAKKSTLNKEQQKVLSEYVSELLQGLRTGATPLEGNLFSAEEEQAFASISDAFGSFNERLKASGLNEALKSQLSGKPSTEINDKATQEYFEGSISAPLRRSFARDVVPEIKRAYGGFTTRRGNAVTQAYEGLTATLASEYGKLMISQEQQRQALAEAAANRQASALGIAGSVLGEPEAAALRYGAVTESRKSRKLSEEARLRPESNPYFEQALALLGTPMTRIVDRPAGLTGFGTALSGISAMKSVFPSSGTGGAVTNTLNKFM